MNHPQFRQIPAELKTGFFAQPQLFPLLLGLFPPLAAARTLQNGLALGLASGAVLLCSSLPLSLLRNRIPARMRLFAALAALSCFTAAADFLLETFFPVLWANLGIYIPLISVNCVLISRAEDFSFRNPPAAAAADALSAGLRFTLLLSGLAALRELLGAGSLWGFSLLPFAPLPLLVSSAGGLILAGLLIAAGQCIFEKRRQRV